MKALMYYGKEDVRLEDVPEPELKPGTIKIHPAFTGICGSDVHLYYDGAVNGGGNSPDHPHPLTGETLPVVFGHEISGTIEAIADDVHTDMKVGDAVVVEAEIACGECPACKAGNYNDCDKLAGIGINGGGGGLSEHIVVPAEHVFPVGDIPLDQAAMIEPFAVAHHAIRAMDPHEGQTAVVGGAGPVGLLIGTILRAKGVRVIMSELSSARKEKALQSHSADIVVDPSKEDLAERVRRETDEAGADLAFDAAGAEPVDHQLLEALKATGGLMVVALHGKPITLNLTKELGFGEKFIRGTMGYANDHPDAIKLIHDRNIDLSTFITDRIKVEDIVDKGFRQLREDAENHVKIIVSM